MDEACDGRQAARCHASSGGLQHRAREQRTLANGGDLLQPGDGGHDGDARREAAVADEHARRQQHQQQQQPLRAQALLQPARDLRSAPARASALHWPVHVGMRVACQSLLQAERPTLCRLSFMHGHGDRMPRHGQTPAAASRCMMTAVCALWPW